MAYRKVHIIKTIGDENQIFASAICRLFLEKVGNFMKKRFLSVVLALSMILGMVPLNASAAETEAFAEPKVTGLSVSIDGGDPIDLLGEQPRVPMSAGSKPVFTVTFDNTELLNQVFVTSTKDNETKYLEAMLQGGKYVTDGYFDSNDTNYIPGTISVTYSKKAVKVDESDSIGVDTLKTQLTAQGVSSRNVKTETDGTITAEIVLNDTLSAMSDVYFDAAVSEFEAGAGIDQSELNKWLGVYNKLEKLSSFDLDGANGKKFTLYLGDGKDFGDADTYLVMVKDVTSNKYTKTLLKKAAGKLGLGDISDALSSANIVTKKLLEYNAISKDTAALRAEIEAHPTMTQQEKTEANEKITTLDHDKKLFLIGMTTVSMMMTAAGGAPLMITALMAGYSSAAGYFWDRRVGMIKGCEPIENTFSESSDHGIGWVALTDDDLVYDQDQRINIIRITKNGQYFLASSLGSAIIEIGERDSDSPLDVTICLHGQHGHIELRSSNSTLKVCDCKYHENTDGTFSGGTGGVSLNEGCNFILESGQITSDIRSNAGEVLINGGVLAYNSNQLGCSIYSENGGKVTVNRGTVSGGICSNGGEVIINKDAIIGVVDSPKDSNGHIGTASLWAVNSSVTINGGQLYNICNEFGEVIINDVILSCSDPYDSYPGIDNYHGTVTVKDGKIGRIINEGGTINIHGGLMENYAQGVWNYADGTVNITGGEIKGIDGGEGIKNGSGGEITISGGRIIGQGGIRNEGAGKVNFVINQNSDILIDGGVSDNISTSIVAVEDYSGGVTYYSSADAQGVPMTIKQAATIDYTLPYVRLVADGAISNPDCQHSYTTVTTSPTCTERGYTTYTCSKCGHSYQGDYTNAMGHRFGEWIVIKEATSTTSGTRERVCSVCQHKETDTIPATGTPSTPSGGSTGGGSYTPPSSTTTTTTKNEDGSTTTKTENKTTGTVTETTKNPDGSQTVVETKKDGTVTTTETDKAGNKSETVAKADGSSVTKVDQKDGATATVNIDTVGKVEAEVKLPEKAVTAAQDSNEAITLPIPEVKVTASAETAPVVTVKTGSEKTVKVVIPTTEITPGTVAVIVKANGTEEVVKTSVATEDGLAVALPDGTTVRIVDNSKKFTDVPADNWAADAVSFSSARELFSGTSKDTFSPNTPMTRAMMMTILARFDGEDTSGGNSWYEKGMDWAVANSISDGRNPNSNITREQLAVMLWRYVGSPASNGGLDGFSDADSISAYAQEAMRWAVENKIINGFGNGRLGPQSEATRAQVAQMLKNFLENQ